MNYTIRKFRPVEFRLLKFFFPNADSGTIMTFGRTILHLNGVPGQIEAHEKVHIKQQKESYLYAIWWWIKYKLSKEFRYRQELEGYAAQFEYKAKRLKHNERQRQIYFREIVGLMKHPQYEFNRTRDEITKDLKEKINE